MSEFGNRPAAPNFNQLKGLPPLPEGFLPRIPESRDVQAERQYQMWVRERKQRDERYHPEQVVTDADLTEIAFVTPTPPNMTEQQFRALPEGQQQRYALEYFYPNGYNLQHIMPPEGQNGQPDSWILEVPVDSTEPSQFPDHPPRDL